MASLSEALKKYSAIVVTGGSSGIGKSFIELSAKLQPDLVICNLSRRFPDISSAKLKLRHVSGDLSRSDEVGPAAKTVVSILNHEAPTGRVLLINNSGFGSCDSFLESNLLTQLEIIDVNVRALVELTGLLLPMLVQRGGGIINIASTAAFQATPYLATYGATKAFVLSWSLALREELRDLGVHVLAVCPGPTRTGFGQRAGLAANAVPTGLGQTPEAVAEISLRAFFSHRGLVVCGWKNRWMAMVAALLPKVLAARLARRVVGLIVQKKPPHGQN